MADPHGGANAEADRALIEWLERLQTRELLILGDLFAAWLGEERLLTPLQKNVLDKLVQLRARNTSIIFVAGNRDYLAEAQLGRAFDRVIEDEAVIDLGGVPTLVAHGDRLNKDDRAYHLWRALSRSKPALAAVRALPGPVAAKIAADIERRLAGTNAAYKTGALPMAALEAFGRRAAQLGASRGLVGHFHHDRLLDVRDGAPVVLAPSWLDQRRVLHVENGALVSVTPS